MLSFSLFITVNTLLMLVSDDYTYPMGASLMQHVPPEQNLPKHAPLTDILQWVILQWYNRRLAQFTMRSVRPLWIHPKGALRSINAHTAQELAEGHFFCAIDCVCCMMLFKCGAASKIYIIRYTTEGVKVGALSAFFFLFHFTLSCNSVLPVGNE